MASADMGQMRFKLMRDCQGEDCRTVALGVGEITKETPAQLQQFINTHPQAKTIFLHSPGGSLGAGLEMGVYLRKHGLDVALTPKMRCLSACAYAFLGGNRREVREGGIVGVHRFHAANGGVSEDDAQVMVANLDEYVTGMGVSGRLLSAAAQAGSDEIVGIGRADAQTLRVDNTRLEPGEWSLSPFEGELVATSQARDEGSDRQLTMMVGSKPTYILAVAIVSDPELHPTAAAGPGYTLSACISGECIHSRAEATLQSYRGEDARMAVFSFDKEEFLDFIAQGASEGKSTLVFAIHKGGWKTHMAGKLEDFHTVISRAGAGAERQEPPTVEIQRGADGVVEF